MQEYDNPHHIHILRHILQYIIIEAFLDNGSKSLKWAVTFKSSLIQHRL